MKFENEEAENLFDEFKKRYGLNHISSLGPISVEDLQKLEKTLIKFNDEV